MFPAGKEVAITIDKLSRMVVTPIEKIREALAESFGMWPIERIFPRMPSDMYARYARDIGWIQPGRTQMKLIDTDIAIDHFHDHRETLEYFTPALLSGEFLPCTLLVSQKY